MGAKLVLAAFLFLFFKINTKIKMKMKTIIITPSGPVKKPSKSEWALLCSTTSTQRKIREQRRIFVKTLVSGTGSKIPEQIRYEANRKVGFDCDKTVAYCSVV